MQVKQKNFKIREDLALDFEIHAKKLKTKEIDLITRYIEEGMQRDKGQTKLD